MRGRALALALLLTIGLAACDSEVPPLIETPTLSAPTLAPSATVLPFMPTLDDGLGFDATAASLPRDSDLAETPAPPAP